MKKYLKVLLAIVLSTCLAACSQNKDTENKTDTNKENTSEIVKDGKSF